LDAPWRLVVERAGQALLQGRFRECELLAGQAAEAAPAEPAPRLLAAAARREQGRTAEAEVLVRAVLADDPRVGEAHALLAAVLADLGRDGEARRRLEGLADAPGWLREPSVAALAAEAAAALQDPDPAPALEAPLARAAGADGAAAAWHGSLYRYLGLVCHLLGRWEDAEVHFDAALAANRAAGAPVQVAHTQRDYAALLRATGDDGDWERAIELLTQAADVYRRLDIGPHADEAEGVLRRSQDHPPAGRGGASGVNVLRRTAAGWEVVFGDCAAVLPDTPGMGHIAALLAADGRPVHVLDLVGPAPPDAMAHEYRAALDELDQRPVPPADPLAAALAGAERDLLTGELADVTAGPSPTPGDRARRLVALRLRRALDRIDAAVPPLAGHLRRSIRTGTFCLYEPEAPARWKIAR